MDGDERKGKKDFLGIEDFKYIKIKTKE